jgi:hypothetical protein
MANSRDIYEAKAGGDQRIDGFLPRGQDHTHSRSLMNTCA